MTITPKSCDSRKNRIGGSWFYVDIKAVRRDPVKDLEISRDTNKQEMLLAAVCLVLSVAVPVPARSLFEDLRALHKVLTDNGGIPGTLGMIHRPDNSNSDLDNDNCTTWSYDNTTIFPSGKFRHEHSTQNKYAGFYGERFVEKPYVVHYVSGPLGSLQSKRVEYCIVHEWGVVDCNNEGTKTHYVFHDQPQIGCQDVPQKITDPTTLPDGSVLEGLVGVVPTEVMANTTAPQLNVLPLLAFYGGAPGLVTASRVKPFNASFGEDDEARDEWLYEYRFTNASTIVRFEHAFLRSNDVGDLSEDFQGSAYWRSSNGDFYIQYRQNTTGFYSDVQKASIAIFRSLWVVTLNTPKDQ